MEVAEASISGGVRTIQYRAKGLGKAECFAAASPLRALSHREGVAFIVNDDVDIAMAVDADGVHLGQEDLPLSMARSILGDGRIIGVSAHTLAQAQEAESGGADYVGVGPIFPSNTKQVRPALGCGVLAEIRKKIRIPVVAIGGITLLNIQPVLETDVDAVAIVSAILSQTDIQKATAEFAAVFQTLRRPGH